MRLHTIYCKLIKDFTITEYVITAGGRDSVILESVVLIKLILYNADGNLVWQRDTKVQQNRPWIPAP